MLPIPTNEKLSIMNFYRNVKVLRKKSELHKGQKLFSFRTSQTYTLEIESKEGWHCRNESNVREFIRFLELVTLPEETAKVHQ